MLQERKDKLQAAQAEQDDLRNQIMEMEQSNQAETHRLLDEQKRKYEDMMNLKVWVNGIWHLIV